MNKTTWVVANFLTYVFLVLLAVALQTSVFPWLFGWRANIQVAVVLLTYICLYREPLEGGVFAVLTGYFLGLMSTMMLSISVFSCLCVFLALRTLKTRVYMPGHVYFTWTTLGAIFGFHFFSWLATFFFESQALHFGILNWILEILLTALFTRGLFHFCVWIDKRTKRLTLTELNS